VNFFIQRSDLRDFCIKVTDALRLLEFKDLNALNNCDGSLCATEAR